MSFRPQHVLVPVSVDEGELDFSRSIVEAAADAAAAFGADLTLLAVTEPDPPWPKQPTDITGRAAASMLEAVRGRVRHAHGRLLALEEVARRRGLRVRSLVVAEARSVADVIVDAAESEGCDLIAVATHGRRGVRRLVHASVAERVAHRARAAVLLLHPRADEGDPASPAAG